MFQSFTIVLLMATVVSMASNTSTADDCSSKFTVTAKRSDDKTEIKTDADTILFSIQSTFGISNAVIQRIDDKWPQQVVLNLHLNGLESFRASNGKVTLEAAVSSRDGKLLAQVWEDKDKDILLDSESLYWMEIRKVSSNDKAVNDDPHKAGYFEIKFPQAFFAGNPKSVTIHWIDFYRG